MLLLVIGAAIQAVLTFIVLEPLARRLHYRIVLRFTSHRPDALTGIWLSAYRYSSRDAAGRFGSEHFVVIRQRGDYVSVKSLTKPVNRRGQREGSRLRMQLRVVDETKLIGEWQERTSKDRLYFGVVHLVVNGTRTEMLGRWSGFNNRLIVMSDEWTMRRLDRSIKRTTRRRYEEQSATLL